jgi:hypothetical protein
MFRRMNYLAFTVHVTRSDPDLRSRSDPSSMVKFGDGQTWTASATTGVLVCFHIIEFCANKDLLYSRRYEARRFSF